MTATPSTTVPKIRIACRAWEVFTFVTFGAPAGLDARQAPLFKSPQIKTQSPAVALTQGFTFGNAAGR
ncbi:MAG: hypothetical protein PVS2B3_09660 [Steroidobacteraceae bacterium]